MIFSFPSRVYRGIPIRRVRVLRLLLLLPRSPAALCPLFFLLEPHPRKNVQVVLRCCRTLVGLSIPSHVGTTQKKFLNQFPRFHLTSTFELPPSKLTAKKTQPTLLLPDYPTTLTHAGSGQVLLYMPQDTHRLSFSHNSSRIHLRIMGVNVGMRMCEFDALFLTQKGSEVDE
ncbi:hypothetical protein K438DRAFT_656881 [Mycena galopus ATCC 62051]|nr:hypothetical protein K438DRAFT_656881 [Mycena galopus ATCC 62051]